MKIIFLGYYFKKQKKYLKKYRNIESDVISALNSLDYRLISSLGKSIYKVRLSSSDVPKGKSGSFRLIVILFKIKNHVVPIDIYFKSEKENISAKELKNDFNKVNNELRNKGITE